MRKKTCRPRLPPSLRELWRTSRQRLRRGENGFVFVAAVCLGLMVTSARGGSLDAPAGPMDPASAMWTLNDIYNVLDTHTTNVTKRTSFREPTAGPTTGTMHSLNDIMTLATNRMPVGKTGQTTSYATDDDGALQIGVAWPNPRFTVVGTAGTAATNQIRDNLTGLIWAQNANMFGQTNWGAAVTNCNNLDYGGQTDWRLPNWQELRSLIDASQKNPALPTGYLLVFAGVVSGNNSWWSSTTDAASTGSAWYVNLYYGRVYEGTKDTVYYVWPVRGGR